MFGHGGKDAGFTNDLLAYVNKGEGMIIMANGDNAGPLISELQVSLSDLYGWNTHKRSHIKEFKQEKAVIKSFAGTYEFLQTVPGIDQYLIDVSVEDNHLLIRDDNDNSTSIMVPIDHLEFANIESGRKVKFNKTPDGKIEGFVWSGRWEFKKLTGPDS